METEEITNNQRFVSAEVIAYELGRTFKSKNWDIGDVRTWCAIVETHYIKDVETMADFEEIDLTIDNNMVIIPCNIFSILDVYISSNEILEYKSNGSYLYDLKLNGVKQTYSDGTKVYMNYKGVNIDENGEILIVKGHEEACKTFCKYQMFEEDAAFGKFNMNMWLGWKTEFSGQYQAAKYNYQHKSRARINNLNIIRGNLIPRIGSLVLHHELFK
jgi:hypothetical protein